MDAFWSSTSRKFYFSMSSALCSVPALKVAVMNTHHRTNQGKITKEFSLIECWLRSRYHTVNDCSTLSSPDEYWVYYFCLFHALEMYSYSLSFHITLFALFSSFKNPNSCSFHRILLLEIHNFLNWPISCYVNGAKPLADTGINTSLKGPYILPT